MKTIMLAVFLLVPSSVYIQAQGRLSLPDMFVWGEDRSEIIGIGLDYYRLNPRLIKSEYDKGTGLYGYLGPTDFISKNIRPKFKLDTAFSDQGEYSFKANVQGPFSVGDYFYGFSGIRETIPSRSFDYNKLSSYGYASTELKGIKIESSLNSVIEESSADKDLWKFELNALASAGLGELLPEFSAISYDFDSLNVSEYIFHIRTGDEVAINQWLYPEVKIDYLSSDASYRRSIYAGLTYVNMEYREFSFTADLGYYGGDQEDINFNIGLNGEVYDYGYNLQLGHSTFLDPLFNFASKYRYLDLANIYDETKANTVSMGLSKNFFHEKLRSSIELGLNNVKDYLTLRKLGDAYIPFNIADEISIRALKLSLQYKQLSSKIILRDANKGIPLLYNEYSLEYSKKIFFGKLVNEYKVVDDYCLWTAPTRLNKQDVGAFAVWNMKYLCVLKNDLSAAVGIENILNAERLFASDIVDEQGQKLYISLMYSFYTKGK